MALLANSPRCGDAVQFSSDLSRDAALHNLHKLVQEQRYSNSEEILFKSRLRGNISDNEVILHRVAPALGSYLLKPIFYGRFVERHGKLILQGTFKISRVFKIWFAASSVILLLLEILFILSANSSQGSPQEKFIAIGFIPAAYCAVVVACLFWKRMYRGDIQWISDKVTAALSG